LDCGLLKIDPHGVLALFSKLRITAILILPSHVCPRGLGRKPRRDSRQTKNRFSGAIGFVLTKNLSGD
jgi:hypothetical protein